jgi:DNA-binding Lrp family transcriptional regulator
MSVSVYILVQTVHDKGLSAAEAIGKLQYVTSVEFLEGPYDVIAKAEVPSDDELGKFLLTQVRGVDGVFRTVTLRVLQV